MQFKGILTKLTTPQKFLVGCFLLVLLLGFWTSIVLVDHTTEVSPWGISDNYQGNEHIKNPEVMKFRKSEREILTIIHTHLLSLSAIFFLVGALVQTTRRNELLKNFISIEPFISLVFTFVGIYFLWQGVNWVSYVVWISGISMTLTFTMEIFIIFIELFRR